MLRVTDEAQDADEVGVQVGDVITNVEVIDDGWVTVCTSMAMAQREKESARSREVEVHPAQGRHGWPALLRLLRVCRRPTAAQGSAACCHQTTLNRAPVATALQWHLLLRCAIALGCPFLRCDAPSPPRPSSPPRPWTSVGVAQYAALVGTALGCGGKSLEGRVRLRGTAAAVGLPHHVPGCTCA